MIVIPRPWGVKPKTRCCLRSGAGTLFDNHAKMNRGLAPCG